MNKETISIVVRNAIDDEKLMNKEVGDIFGTSPVYFSYLKNRKYWDITPMSLWEDLRTWMYSGKKLKGYKVPEKKEPESDEAIQNQEANRAMTEQIKEKIAEKQEPKIKVKPEALNRRKRELAEKEAKEQMQPEGEATPPVNPINPDKKHGATEGAKEFLRGEKAKVDANILNEILDMIANYHNRIVILESKINNDGRIPGSVHRGDIELIIRIKQ